MKRVFATLLIALVSIVMMRGAKPSEVKEQELRICTVKEYVYVPVEKTVEVERIIYQSLPADEYRKEELDALARLLYGEYRGASLDQQAAVVWCVLNRVDSANPYFPDSIIDVITQPYQFAGYSPNNPVVDNLRLTAEDVVRRWELEKLGVGEVGRILPKEYLFFTGNGTVNKFTTQHSGGMTWYFTAESPYEEG